MSSFLGFSTLPLGREPALQGSPQRIGHHHQQQLQGVRQSCAADEVERLPRGYEEEAARLAEQLSLCGIQQQSLSPEAQQSHRLLVQLACALHITQATPQALLSAWAMLLVQQSKAATMQRTLQRELASLAVKRSTAQQKLAALQRALSNVQAMQSKEAGNLPHIIKVTKQLQEKRATYEAQSSKLEHDLARHGFKPELKHSALLEKHSQLQGLQQQLAELTQQLSRYHELPATLLGTRMKLNAAKKQFEEKQERFRSHLSDT